MNHFFDWRLEHILGSLVIADQHAAVNIDPSPIHTARHTLGIGFARSIRPVITLGFFKDIYVILQI